MQSMDAGSRRQGCGEQTAGHTRVYVCIHTRVYVCTYVSIQPGGTAHTLFFFFVFVGDQDGSIAIQGYVCRPFWVCS